LFTKTAQKWVFSSSLQVAKVSKYGAYSPYHYSQSVVAVSETLMLKGFVRCKNVFTSSLQVLLFIFVSAPQSIFSAISIT